MDKSKINMHKRMAMGMREGGMGGRSGSICTQEVTVLVKKIKECLLC